MNDDRELPPAMDTTIKGTNGAKEARNCGEEAGW